MQHKQFFAVAIAAASISSLALGHAGPRIWIDVQNNKVITFGGPYPPDGIVADYPVTRVFPELLPLAFDDDPLNFSTQFPGYQEYPWSSIPAGTTFSYNIPGEVQWFNTSDKTFEPISQAFPTQTPSIAVTNGLGNTQFSSTGFVNGDLAFSFNGDPTDHAHLTYTIVTPEDLADGFDPEDAPAGVYALPLQLTSNRTSIPSDTFYILMGDNVTQSELTLATQVLSGTTWTGSSGASWNTGSNWSDGASPGTTAGRFINLYGPGFKSLTTGGGTVNVAGTQTVGTLNFKSSNPYTVAGGTLRFDGTILDVATATTTPAPGAINVYAPLNSVTGLPIPTTHTLASNVELQQPLNAYIESAQTLILSGTLTTHNNTLTQTGPGTMQVNSFIGSSLSIQGGTFRIAPTGTPDGKPSSSTAGTSLVTNLTLPASLDLTDNNLIVANPSAYSTILAYVTRSYAHGAWTGSGLGSSYAAANGHTGLAVAASSSLLGPSGGTFSGQTVDGSSTLVRYTWYGDINMNGSIDADDFARMDRALAKGGLSSGATWLDGDFNYDGKVNSADLMLLDTSFAVTGGTFSPDFLAAREAQFGTAYVDSFLASVPEPGALSIASLSTAFLLGRRKKRASRNGLATLVALSLAPAVSFAHGPNVQIAVINNQVVTTHYFLTPNETGGESYNPLYTDGIRVIHVPMVQDTDGGTTFGISNNGWYAQPLSDGTSSFTGPGIAYGANLDPAGNPVSNGFSASTDIPLTITEFLTAPLQIWNGSGFVTSTSDRLQGIRGALGGLTATALYSSPTASESSSWSTTQKALTPDSHNQVEWRLDTAGTQTPDLNPADGIYLATLQIGTTELVNGLPVANSLPFYFLLEKNATPDQTADATSFLNTYAVPEPSSIRMLPVSALTLLLRRRSRGVA